MVDDQFFSSSDRDIIFHVTYFDDSNGGFDLQYNATGAFDQSIAITKTNTNQWLTKSLMVADAAFDNQLDYQADFRIKGEAFIRSVSIDKPAPSDVSVVFDEQIIQNGMEFLVRTDPTRETWTEQVTIGDHISRYIPWEEKRKYGYFRVNDAIINPTDNELTFDFTYFDKGTKAFSFEYNSTTDFYHDADIGRTNTNTWMTRSYPVRNAAFANKQNNQSDFRIRGEAHVRRVAVRLGIEDPEVPEIPIVFVTPKEPENPTGIESVESLAGQVWLEYQMGILTVRIPEEMVSANVSVYNYMGQVVYSSSMNQTEERFQIPAHSNVYIVAIQHGGQFLTRLVSAF
jgi:hypothetical protein